MSIQALRRDLRLPNMRLDPRGIAFFLIVPLALAAVTATTTGYSRTLGYGGALLYVGLLSLIPWWIGEGTTRIAWFGLKRFKPPLWLLCKVGILLACVIVGPYASFVTSLFANYWPGNGIAEGLSGGGQSGLGDVTVQVLRAIFFWVTANYVFDRFLDYPRFRYNKSRSIDADPMASARPSTGMASTLLRRATKFADISEVLVVKAEEHYVRLFGHAKEELVASGFGGAMKDLQSEDGFQVHRSYWVRRDAVVGWRESGSKLNLEITNGAIIPVSGPYQALVRQLFEQAEDSL